MGEYIFTREKIKQKCFELNESIQENDLKLNIIPDGHEAGKKVSRYQICIHRNMEEPPISLCILSFEAIEACFENDNCIGLKKALDGAISEALNHL